MSKEVNFSDKELRYINDTDFLLTKRQVNEKINQLLVTTEEKIARGIEQSPVRLPEGTLQTAGKISKGENYKNLPYFMLDFPRKFSKKGIFAFRTMFWWGHFFSATLHLQGINLEEFRTTLLKNSNKSYGNGIYFCVADTPWEYHYGKDNYQPVDQLEKEKLQEMIYHKEFVKLSKKLNLDQWEHLPEFSFETFNCLIDLLKEDKR